MPLELKARSNLKINPAFALNDKEIKSGFVGLYLNSARLNPTLFLRLWLSGATPIVDDPKFAKSPSAKRAGSIALMKNLVVGSIRMEKKTDHFVVNVPVGTFSNISDLHTNLSLFVRKSKKGDVETEDDNESEDDVEIPGLEDLPPDEDQGPDGSMPTINLNYGRIDGLAAIAKLGAIPPQVKAALAASLMDVLVIPHGSDGVRASLTFKITKNEAQFLSNTGWHQIRPIDLYSMMQAWALSFYGGLRSKAAKPPKTAIPISVIASGIPTDEGSLTIKTSDKGLAIDGQGALLYIPRARLDQTARYEDLFIQAGTKDDSGVFRLVDLDSDQPKQNNLPINTPVLIDWVNSKFSYTNTSGLLTVMDMTRFQPANSTHVNTFLKRKVDPKILANLFRLGAASETDVQLKFEDGDMQYQNTEGEMIPLGDYIADRLKVQTDPDIYFNAVWTFLKGRGHDELRYQDLAFNSEVPLMRPIGRALRTLALGVKPRLETVYQKYSIQFVTHNLGWLILIYEYAHLHSEVDIEDRTNRQAALTQGVDPNWKQEAIPLVNSPRVGRLPHQRKIANLLRGSPDFAILPVQAGGGKSMIGILDILQELKKNKGAPYLIMCPGHLIPNYVKELVFFTRGRLNVISITSYTILKNGMERLTKMIQNAPRNTVVLTNYDTLSLQRQQICYGTSNITVYPIVDLLRQFGFGYALLDESHYLKNPTNRTRAVLSLISDIKMKRLMSGTMAHDSPSDMAQQIAMLDPTLFGTRDEFNERFGDTVKGGRVIEWKPGAQAEIMNMIKSRIVVAGAMRKEWAALLPPIEERFIRVNLTPEQQRVYSILLRQAVEEIKADRELMARMSKGESDEDDTDEEAGEDLAALLKPYLQRLERYISAPAQDPLGNIELKGDDRVSPKLAMVESLISQHLNRKLPGKVLIFTNYVVSAEEIYAGLSDSIRSKMVMYHAGSKVEDHARFETDDSIIGMIGVEDSMNTGLNLQFVSRLIRLETVWNPGTLEQGNSRLNRPNLKTDEERDTIYYDWIVADNTIDITKISRLVSKIISVAKFENASDKQYEALPDLPIIRMNLDSLINLNDWNSTLAEYAEAYSQYQGIVEADYAAYREEFVRKHGNQILEPTPEAPPAPDMKLMKQVPYVQGLAIFGEDELGLVRLDMYMRSQDLSLEIANFTDQDESTVETGEDNASLISTMMKGRRAHTEFGDGEIVRLSMRARRVFVRFDDDTQSPFPWSTVFIETRQDTSGADIRTQLLKTSGELPIDTPIDTPARAIRQVRITKKEQREREKEKQQAEQELQDQMQVELSISVTNGFLGLVYYQDENEIASKSLEALGFRPTEPFYYAHIPNALTLKRQIELWNSKGFEPDATMENEMAAIVDLYHLLKEGKLQNGTATFRLANRNELRNFYRMEHKPNSNAKLIRPYPLIEDGRAYLVLPIRGQIGTKNAIKIRSPRIQWQLSDPSLTYYALTHDKIGKMITKVRNAGITIVNIKDLHKQYQQLKRMKARDKGILEV